MCSLLISLGSAVGQQRAPRAPGEFVFEARPGQLAAAVLPDVSKRFATRPSLAPNKRDAWLGAYPAHYLVWKEIAKLDHGCFVLEDDCTCCAIVTCHKLPTCRQMLCFSWQAGWLAGRSILNANNRSWLFGVDEYLKQLAIVSVLASEIQHGPQKCFLHYELRLLPGSVIGCAASCAGNWKRAGASSVP